MKSVLCCAIALSPLAAHAQQPPGKIPLVAWMRVAVPEPIPGKPLRDALAARGLVDGQDIRLVLSVADGKPERLPELAEELVRNGAAVIVPFGSPATHAAQTATKTIPIVAVTNFLEGGFAPSMARPAGNLTGVSILASELSAKRLEVLKELLPDAKRFAVLNDTTQRAPDRGRVLAEAANKLGVALTTVDVRAGAELETAFEAFQKESASAVYVLDSPLFAQLRQRIGQLSAKHGIPAICQWREMVEAGCLASYGVTQAEMFGLVAEYIDRVLKGAKPAELPIVQPTRFELTINMRVAREMGLTLAPAVVARADEVIE